MSLFDRLAAIEQRGFSIAERLGMPQHRNVVVRHQSLDDNRMPLIQDTLLAPKPYVTSASPRLVGLLIGNDEQAVSVSATDLTIEVPRTIDYSMFVREDNKRAKVIIDPPVTGGSLSYENSITKELKGVHGRIIHIDDSDSTIWTLVVRRERD